MHPATLTMHGGMFFAFFILNKSPNPNPKRIFLLFYISIYFSSFFSIFLYFFGIMGFIKKYSI